MSLIPGQLVTNGHSITVFIGDGAEQFLERLPHPFSYVIRATPDDADQPFKYLTREMQDLRPATTREIMGACKHWSISRDVCPWCIDSRGPKA